jgi:hypothetical protein
MKRRREMVSAWVPTTTTLSTNFGDNDRNRTQRERCRLSNFNVRHLPCRRKMPRRIGWGSLTIVKTVARTFLEASMPTPWNRTPHPNRRTVSPLVVDFSRFTAYSYSATTPHVNVPILHPLSIMRSQSARVLVTMHVPVKSLLNDGDTSFGQRALAMLSVA